MNDLQYPLHFLFRVTSFANDFTATDDIGQTIFYVSSKLFSWRDHIIVYRDETKTEILYELKSNKLIDFQQTFSILDKHGRVVGKVRRKSLKSLWRSTFNLLDENDRLDHTIQEKDPWTKFFDGLFGEIPILGMLTGYFFNPTYLLLNSVGENIFEIKKKASFFGRKFSVHKVTNDEIDAERLILSLMLMVLIERRNS